MSMNDYGRASQGLTLIELMVVVVVLGVLAALIGPSFTRIVQDQRIKSINAQLVTDIQYARGEAATRNQHVRITFRKNTALSCYTLYTYTPDTNINQCNCLSATPCSAAGLTEIRTAQIPADSGVTVWPLDIRREFAVDSRNGGMFRPPSDALFVPALVQFEIETYIDSSRKLKTVVGLSGRPTVCKPAGSTLSAPACS